jgi:uncharacterized protein (DUF2236 family)
MSLMPNPEQRPGHTFRSPEPVDALEASPIKMRPSRTDFLNPSGDRGLFGPGSITWRVFSNSLSNAVGGIAAVILELAEPAVRAGVWEHSTFRIDPIGRMRNTGRAAQSIVYGPVRSARETFDRVNRMHERVAGETHEGKPYRATDPDLITWVHVTAGWGFLNAYMRYVEPRMSRADQDLYYAEREEVGYGFGAHWVPTTVDGVEDYMKGMMSNLYANDTVQEFIRLVGDASLVGTAARPLQRLFVQAAIDLLTEDMRSACGVQATHPLGRGLRPTISALVKATRAGRRMLPDGPAQQACRRMNVSTGCLVP